MGLRKVESRKCEKATVRKARLQGRFNQKAAGMKSRGEKDGEKAPRISGMAKTVKPRRSLQMAYEEQSRDWPMQGQRRCHPPCHWPLVAGTGMSPLYQA